MEIEKKISLLSEILEAQVSDISPDDLLDKFSSWDSMAALSLIVMLEENFNKSDIDGKMIKSFIFVRDILNIMEK
jgi:acyl carrier protein